MIKINPQVVDQELIELQLDRPDRVKSQEQIEQHSIDAQYENKPIERSVYLLTKGDEIQKLSIVQSLPELYRLEPNATVTRVLPKIQHELHDCSSEFNIAAARTFQVLIKEKVPVNFLTTVLAGIESPDAVVATTWIETLLDVTNDLSENQLRNEVLKWAMVKSSDKQTLFRVASCHLLGKCAIHPKVRAIDMRTKILPLVQGLAQDENREVRSVIAGQFACIATGLKDSNVIKNSLLPCLVELAKDPEEAVQSSAIIAITDLLGKLSADVIREVVVPLFKELCQRTMIGDDTSLPALAKEYGNILIGIKDVLNQNDSVWFLKFYKTLSTKGLGVLQGDSKDPSVGVFYRSYSAQCLPAVTTFAMQKATNAMDVWFAIFRDLAIDPCYLVRKCVAERLHTIVGILGSECRFIKADIIRLLRDDSEDVLNYLVPKIGVILELSCHYGLMSKEATTQTSMDMGRAVLNCLTKLSKGVNWRAQLDMLIEFEHLPNCLPSDFIHQYFTPTIFAMLSEQNPVMQKARPVKIQAAKLLLVFLRYNIREIQRKWLRDNLLHRLHMSSSSYTRLIFIKMCDHAMNIFSRKYFKQYFFQPLLSLLEDSISNIRLCTVLLLPKMKGMLSLEDRQLIRSFESAIKRVEVMERDKDVLHTLGCVFKTMQSIQFHGMKQVDVQDEKQKQDEELKVAQGRIIENLTVLSKLSFIKPAPEVQPTKASMQNPAQRTLSFLDQPFCTDASIMLPFDELSKREKLPLQAFQESCEPLPFVFPSERKLPDVKVTLRKNVERNEVVAIKLNHRKSLNNLSRIPVRKNRLRPKSEVFTSEITQE